MNQIKLLRQRISMSQAELARKLNVTQGNVSMWENGTTSPRAEKLSELARILGCSIDDLFAKDEQTA